VLGDSIVRSERRIRDVAQTGDGDLLVLTDGDKGEFLRLSPAVKKPTS
jgi:glucose/arabinose dehydrogenase